MGITSVDNAATNASPSDRLAPTPSKNMIPQPYDEANDFAIPVIESPDTISSHFKWARHLIEPNNIATKYNTFASETQFPVDGQTLTGICHDTFNFCGTVYNNVLFPPGSPRLPYHNLDHAFITSITAQKIFLGGLVQEAKNGKIPLQPKERIKQLHSLFSLVSSFHEIDDWWNLPYPGTTGNNPHIEKAKNAITEQLTKLNLSTHDFNRMLLLDDFRESQEVSLGNGLNLERGKGFLTEDNHLPSLIDDFSLEERTLLLTLASKGLCAGDFLQVINPAYLQPMTMQIGKDVIVEGRAGQYALAVEMSKWRKNALKPPGFGNPENGEIYWDKIKLTLGFFEGIALPRIYSGLDYLKVSAPTEYNNATAVIANKLAFLHQAIEKEKLEEAKKKLMALQ
jgi:hypothetical protein